MIANYYTLRHITSDLQHQLAGSSVVRAFSQNKNELVLGFRARDGAEQETTVIVGCEPSMNFVYVRDSFSRARRNSVDLFEPVIGERLVEVCLAPGDREISFRLSSDRQLLVQLYGSKANVLLCDEDRTVLDSFLKAAPPGTHTSAPLSSNEVSHLDDFRSGLRDASPSAVEPVRVAFKRLFPRYGNTLTRELFHRAGISTEIQTASLSDRDVESLFNVQRIFHQELLSALVPAIYYDGSTPVEFAIVPLHHLERFRAERFETVHSAIRTFLGSVHVRRTFHDERKAMTAILERESEQADRTVRKLDLESVQESDGAQFERMGKLLTAHLHELHKGMSEAIVEDPVAGSGELVLIPLDVHLSPAKNAERLFERAKRIRRTAEEQRIRKEDLENRRERLQAVLADAEQIDSLEDLHQFAERHAAELAQLGIRLSRPGKPSSPPPPFRIFTVAGGFQVWAGKSGENNDLLSTRHTAKNDLWFHARGVGGSHVVLKVGTGKGEVSKTAIQQAASIAAYYSKMKNASFVPVTMCEGKYVRKSKGAPAGTVTVERERTIFAEPQLPEPTSE